VVLDALDVAHNAIKGICALQNELRSEVGKPKVEVTHTPKYTAEFFNELMAKYGPTLRLALLTQGKQARRDAVKNVKAQMVASVPPEDLEKLAALEAAYAEME